MSSLTYPSGPTLREIEMTPRRPAPAPADPSATRQPPPRPTSERPALEGRRTAVSRPLCWWRDYLELTKPRILLMILLTVGAGAACAAGSSFSWAALLHTLLGTSLVAAGASALNQVVERDQDRRMRRTRNRPLPAGRLTQLESSIFGAACGLGGTAYLLLTTNPQAAALAAATFVLYVAVYTPLKLLSAWNTAVGTLPGAMPVLIGCAGVGGSVLNPQAWLVTAVVVLWQFPHFMSIAWLFREDYERGGYRMWTTGPTQGRVAAAHAVAGAAALVPVAAASIRGVEGLTLWVCLAIVLLAGGQQLVASVQFARRRDDRTARRLLRSSLLVLPLILLAVIWTAAL